MGLTIRQMESRPFNPTSKESSPTSKFSESGKGKSGETGVQNRVSTTVTTTPEAKEGTTLGDKEPQGQAKQLSSEATRANVTKGDTDANKAKFKGKNADQTNPHGVTDNSNTGDDQKPPWADPKLAANKFKEQFWTSGGLLTRRKKDKDGDDGRKRQRRKFHRHQEPTEGIIEGAMVGESQTQDMFIPSRIDSARLTGGVDRQRSIIEQMKEYSMGDPALAIYHTVSANIETKAENGVGSNMQKSLFTDFVKLMTEVSDVYSSLYKRQVREIIQGALLAAKRHDIGLKEISKIIITGLIHVSPHDDNPESIAEIIRLITSEMLYTKVNIKVGMKLTSYNLGASLFTLIKYFENHQNTLEFNKHLKNYFTEAFSNAIWDATGQLTNYSQSQANANIDQFITGRVNEEREYQDKYIKSALLSPLKKVEDNKFVRGIMNKFGK